MSQVSVRTVFKGVEETQDALLSLSRGIQGDLVSGLGIRLSNEATKVLAVLTPRLRQRSRSTSNPRTRRGFPPLHRGWRAIVTDRVAGIRYRALVQNIASNNAAGQIILLALEGGAKPHDIDPVHARVLAWRSPRTERRFLGRFESGGHLKDAEMARPGVGGIVFWPGTTRTGVRHPGHQPFAMVQKAFEHMDRISGPILAIFSSEVASVWLRVGFPGGGALSGSLRGITLGSSPINLSARRSSP